MKEKLLENLIYLLAMIIAFAVLCGAGTVLLFLTFSMVMAVLAAAEHATFTLSIIWELTSDSFPTIAMLSLLILLTILVDNR